MFSKITYLLKLRRNAAERIPMPSILSYLSSSSATLSWCY